MRWIGYFSSDRSCIIICGACFFLPIHVCAVHTEHIYECDSRSVLAHSVLAPRLCGCYVQQPLMSSSSIFSLYVSLKFRIRFSLNRAHNLHIIAASALATTSVFLLYAFISENRSLIYTHTIQYMKRQILQATQKERQTKCTLYNVRL